MKRIYQQPELFACELGLSTMIAQSPKTLMVDKTKTVDDDAVNYTKDSRTDLWSDDW